MRTLLLLFAVLGACSNPGDAANQRDPLSDQRAFPDAQGFGAYAKGGRDGRIMAVTTLADSGAGSLRACLEAKGPRWCVFRVGGLIRFTREPPVVRNPFLTIAGQTAPGDGITLTHSGGANGRTPLVIKNTHDVVVRDIRVRNDRIGGERGSEDAITIENSHDVILDHVSTSWARDELVGPYGDNDRITISWSIFSHGIPRHDNCALLGSDPQGPQSLSFIGNVCAHNGDRNPDINFPPRSCVEMVNNVIYNAQSQFTEIWESYGGTPVSVVGNVYRAGPNTSRAAIGIDHVRIASRGPARIYARDNVFDGKFVHTAPDLQPFLVEAPPCPLTVDPLPADEVLDTILSQAGAAPRDPVDEEVVRDVRRRGGKIVHQPGTIPPIANGTPYPDADADGMDDRWEAANGAIPGKFDAWADSDGDGWSNLNAFLAYAHHQRMRR